ncbi:hypothetical protein [Methanolobus chelungpuianus]|uniref:Uncharacterized protein n=1 Tax=Methanolobus chelungpuianus TaxID=502115 RepID=A0AAE3KY96_9EURY|nr:hypothetical protein [Methanolobus chelungpuianus]MCQ6962794.1 hypothetical protein [Methanolobus chelungpuianus]
MAFTKKPDKQKEQMEESKAQVAAAYAGLDPSFLQAIQDAGNDGFMVPDPNVDLTRDLAKIALGIKEYRDSLPQMTNLEHPVQSTCLTANMTDLELMRAMGMSQHVYNILKGDNLYVSGFAGMLKTRMGIIYPGAAGVELHPRVSVLGSLFARLNMLREAGKR